MNTFDRAQVDPARIERDLLALGFDRVGFVPAGETPDFARYEEWLARGFAGEMDYLVRGREARRDPRKLLPEARSVVLVSLSYHVPDPGTLASAEHGRGWVSRYAWGRDYHKVLKVRLRAAARLLETEHGARHTRVCVDSAPLLERSLAAAAGLGWIGKNTMLIDTELGSYTFLAALLCDLEIRTDATSAPDRCGSCTACLDACPTNALAQPGWLDARRCISYLTIEKRSEVAPELAALMGEHVFGCDLCQEVCPWNRDAPETSVRDFHPRPGLRRPELAPLLDLDRTETLHRFAGTPLMRAGAEGLRRNARIALANQERAQSP